MSDQPPAPATARQHELKCWPEFFSAILSGEKTFELRRDDRGFRVGDVLWLREWRRLTVNPVTGVYTGRELRLPVTYVLSGFGLERDYVVMGFRPIAAALAAAEVRQTEEPWQKVAEMYREEKRLAEEAEERSHVARRETEQRADAAEARAAAAEAKIADYEARPWPGCRMLSKGDACDCSLCKAEARATALEQERDEARRFAKIEQNEAVGQRNLTARAEDKARWAEAENARLRTDARLLAQWVLQQAEGNPDFDKGGAVYQAARRAQEGTPSPIEADNARLRAALEQVRQIAVENSRGEYASWVLSDIEATAEAALRQEAPNGHPQDH